MTESRLLCQWDVKKKERAGVVLSLVQYAVASSGGAASRNRGSAAG